MAELLLLEKRSEWHNLSKEHINFKIDKGLEGKISARIRYLVLRLLGGENMSWTYIRQELDSVKEI